MRPARLGLIGLGKMGLSHLAIANALDNFEVTFVSDLNRLVGRSVARYTGSRFVRNYRRALEDPSAEAVLVSVPTHLHQPVAGAALANGKHVFLEKPLTLTPGHSMALWEQAEAAGLVTQVGYVNRLSPLFRHLEEMIASGNHGAVVAYECAMRGNVVGSEGAQGWRNNRRMGGGCLYEYGSHCIDLSLFLFGSVSSLDSATLERRVSSDVEDFIEARVTHSSGVEGHLVIDWADGRYRKATNTVAILTNQALIVATKQEISVFEEPPPDLKEALDVVSGQSPSERINLTDLDTGVPYYLRGEDFTQQLVHFYDLIRGQTTPVAAQFPDAFATDSLISEIFAAEGP